MKQTTENKNFNDAAKTTHMSGKANTKKKPKIKISRQEIFEQNATRCTTSSQDGPDTISATAVSSSPRFRLSMVWRFLGVQTTGVEDNRGVDFGLAAVARSSAKGAQVGAQG